MMGSSLKEGNHHGVPDAHCPPYMYFKISRKIAFVTVKHRSVTQQKKLLKSVQHLSFLQRQKTLTHLKVERKVSHNILQTHCCCR